MEVIKRQVSSVFQEELGLTASANISEGGEHSSPKAFDQCKAAADHCWRGIWINWRYRQWLCVAFSRSWAYSLSVWKGSMTWELWGCPLGLCCAALAGVINTDVCAPDCTGPTMRNWPRQRWLRSVCGKGRRIPCPGDWREVSSKRRRLAKCFLRLFNLKKSGFVEEPSLP